MRLPPPCLPTVAVAGPSKTGVRRRERVSERRGSAGSRRRGIRERSAHSVTVELYRSCPDADRPTQRPPAARVGMNIELHDVNVKKAYSNVRLERHFRLKRPLKVD